jgi:broad specificity phosphatase PhoE/ribonuclease HI
MRVIVEADGGSRGNPGPAGYGAVVRDADSGAVLAERKDAIGIETNNVAEYQGLIAGLTAAKELGATAVRVRLDSKLLVEQMSGRWQVKHPSMRPLARQASQLAGTFAEISFEWIPRAQNSHADRLANEAMDAAAGRPITAVAAKPAQQQLEMPTPQTAWVAPDSTPTRLILVRHGVTEYSVAKRFAGRSDLELTDEGTEQAKRAARRVADLGPVHAVVSSPLRRTRQTAAAIATALNLDVGISEGMVEADFGDWDGYTFAEVQEKWPGELSAWMADPTVAPPNGESFDTVTRRVRRARNAILTAHTGETVVVVSHVSPIKILVRLALDAPPSALHRMYLAPASISVIDYFSDGPVSLRSFNDSAHV